MSYYDSMMLISLSTINTGFIRFSGNTSSKLYFCYKDKNQKILQLLLLKTINGGYIVDKKNFSNFVSVCRYIYQRFSGMAAPSLWKIILFKVGKIPLLRKHYDDILKECQQNQIKRGTQEDVNLNKLNRLVSNQSAPAGLDPEEHSNNVPTRHRQSFISNLVAKNRERFRLTRTDSQNSTSNSETEMNTTTANSENHLLSAGDLSLSGELSMARHPLRHSIHGLLAPDTDTTTDRSDLDEEQSATSNQIFASNLQNKTKQEKQKILAKSALQKSLSLGAAASAQNLNVTNNLKRLKSSQKQPRTLDENSETPLSATQLSLGSRSKSCRSVASLGMYRNKCVTFGKINVRYINSDGAF